MSSPMVLLLALAGWLALSVAAAMLLGPVAGWLKRTHRAAAPPIVVTPPAPGLDLMSVAEAHDVDPQPTYGQERIYAAAGLVQVGLAMVHRRCADARRDTDKICPECGPKFARVSA